LLTVHLAAARYTAPEKLDGSATPSTFPKGDVWSLLQIWCALLANCCPFYFIAGEPNQLSELYSGPDAQARLEQLMDAHYTHLLPPAALAFFKWGLQVDPQQRPRAVEVLGHPYMQGRVVGAGRSEGLVLA
jgi:serine/threonine protein kinase